ncbi:MAG: ATP-binding protein [Rickettsiaceae bacterium]
MTFNIDAIIFVAFLVINLIVGLKSSKKIKTIKDYALGGRNFVTPILVTTIVATWASGSSFFITLSKTYSDGILYTMSSFGLGISFLLTAFFLVPRMGEFLGNTSVAESMGNLYGKQVRIISAIAGCIGTSGMIAVQFKVFGSLFNYFLGIPGELAVIISAIVVIIYSAFGGIRAVTYTDVVQFIAFSFAIPMVSTIIWYKFGFSLSTIKHTFDVPIFDYKYAFSLDNPALFGVISYVLVLTIPDLSPAFYQRIIIGRNIIQVRKAFIISAIMIVFIKVVMSWLPFLVYSVNPNLQQGQLLGYIIDNYSFSGLKGLIIIGITAMAMSTADSHLNASSVLFSNDFCKPLNIKFVNPLTMSKIFVFISGCFSLILALTQTDLVNIVLIGASFYKPIVTTPLILTIFGFRSNARSILIGMAAGLATVIAFFFIPTSINSVIPGMIANLIFLLSSHYILKSPGGWVGINDNAILKILKAERRHKIQIFFKSIIEFNLIRFCLKHKPVKDSAYTAFGIFCFLFTIASIYLTHEHHLAQNTDIILYFYQTMLVISTFFMLWYMWSLRIKNEVFIGIAWHFSLIYMLVFCSSFFLLINNFGQFALTIFTINLSVLCILTRWQTAVVMTMIGMVASRIFYCYVFQMPLSISFENGYFEIIYILLMMSAAILTFIKPKQEKYEINQEKANYLTNEIYDRDLELQKALSLKNEFISKIDINANYLLNNICNIAEELIEKYSLIDDEQKKSIIADIVKQSKDLHDLVSNIMDFSHLSSMKLDLNKKNINLSALLDKTARSTYYIYGDQENQILFFDIDKDIIINCDEYYISRVFTNLILNALQYCKEGTITLRLRAKDSYVQFTISDQGIGIPNEKIYDVFSSFMVDDSENNSKGIGLALCKKIIEIHNGQISVTNNKFKGCSFVFTLPMNSNS